MIYFGGGSVWGHNQGCSEAISGSLLKFNPWWCSGNYAGYLDLLVGYKAQIQGYTLILNSVSSKTKFSSMKGKIVCLSVCLEILSHNQILNGTSQSLFYPASLPKMCNSQLLVASPVWGTSVPCGVGGSGYQLNRSLQPGSCGSLCASSQGIRQYSEGESVLCQMRKLF